MSRLFNNTLLTGFGMVFFQGSNFLLAIFMMRMAGPEALGSYQFFIATTTFFSLFGRIGGDESLTYSLPHMGGIKSSEGRAYAEEIFNSAVWAALLSGIASILFSYVLEFLAGGELSPGIALYAVIYVPAFVGYLLIGGIFRAEQRIAVRSFLAYLFPIVINFSVLLVLFQFSKFGGEEIVVLSRVVAYVFVFAAGLFILGRDYHWLPYKRSSLMASLKGGWLRTGMNGWLFITVAALLIDTGTLGIWIAKIVLPPEEVGYFAVILRLSSLVLMASTALTIVAGPAIAKTIADNKGQTVSVQTWVFVINGLAVSSIGIVFWVTAGFWLELFDPALVVYVDEMRMLLTGAVVLAFSHPIYSILLARRDLKSALWVTGGSLLCGIFVLSLLPLSTIPDLVFAITTTMVIAAIGRVSLVVVEKVRSSAV